MIKTEYNVRRQESHNLTKKMKIKKFIAEPLHKVFLYFIFFFVVFIHIAEILILCQWYSIFV